MAEEIATSEITCGQCGNTFRVRRERNWQNRRYCGPECARLARQSYRPQYLRKFAKRPLVCSETGTKVCHGCGQEKPVAQFHRSTNYADGRLNQCSACKKAYIAILRGREDPAQRAERLARKREHSRAWKKRNKDKIREYTRRTTAANTARHEKWRRANPERFKVHIAASNYKRRQKKKGGMTGAQTRAWMDAQKKICHWCGKNCADLPTIDHLTPLSKGGMHEADNLVIACKPCNSRKHAKDPIKFAQELGRLL